MEKKSPEFYDFLINPVLAEKFFNECSKEIFGQSNPIKIQEVDRAYTYNKDSYNVFYKLTLDGQERKIRISTSRVIEKRQNHLILKHFFNNGFNQPPYLVPKPLAYLESLNLNIYEHIDGEILMEHLDRDQSVLSDQIGVAAGLAQKIHQLPQPDFPTWNPHQFFDFKDFEEGEIYEFYPEVKNIFSQVILLARDLYDKKEDLCFCHGDYQPANLLFNPEGLYLLDLDLACPIQKEYDIATFLSQLAVMFARYNKTEQLRALKEKFLTSYGDFNQENFHIYNALVNLRILSVFSMTNDRDHNEAYMKIAYQSLIDSLKYLDIKTDA